MESKPLTVISLDVGFCHTGVVITQYSPGIQAWEVIDTGCVSTEKESEKRRIYATDDRMRRIDIIFNYLGAMVASHQPSLIVAELPASGGKSAAAHASMGMATAIVVCLGRCVGIPIRNYNWDEIKLAATGARNASKEAVQQAIAKRYPLVAEKYVNPRKKSGYTDEFEHISDALGAWECAKTCDIVQALIKSYGGAQ